MNQQDRMVEHFDEIVDNGMNQADLKQLQEREKQKALENLER